MAALVFAGGGRPDASEGGPSAVVTVPARESAPASAPPGTAASPKASASPNTSKSAKSPKSPRSFTSGNGVFVTAEASGEAVGKGTPRRYKVQVEEGTGIAAEDAAHEIEKILGSPRGWIADGRDAFRLVSGGSFDFEVKIASPDTVDRICGAAGLHTHGEVNCDVGDQVIVNLKRWNSGSPEFPGPLGDYRALIINHEVGHRIGHGHETCPGPGRPAPVMMQQIDGLHGCVANAWPYDAHGAYLSGPPVP